MQGTVLCMWRVRDKQGLEAALFFLKFIYFIYFIFGCVGSSLLRTGFL